MARPDGRRPDELRPFSLELGFQQHAEGSVLLRCGTTWVLCAASVEEKVPSFVNPVGHGWVTAEYAMLPRSTHTRSGRSPGGRGQEIQRLVGRALRGATDRQALGPRTITVDCDVLSADGGTRTASITGGWIALALAVEKLRAAGKIAADAVVLGEPLAAVSVGLVDGEPRLDLAYEEDAHADVDMNVVMTESGRLVEIQGTAEGRTFSRAELDAMLGLAHQGITELCRRQREAVEQMRVVLATRNRGKAADVRHLLAEQGLVLDLIAVVDVEPPIPDIEETGVTFEENALLKARETCRLTGLPALADDSGLEVDALGGAPGVYSARYAGLPSDDARNNHKLLAALAEVEERTARFRSVVALVEPGGRTLTGEGSCDGTILRAPRGAGGFGYDPLFFCPELGKTFAEASLAEKGRVSHRSRAMTALRARW